MGAKRGREWWTLAAVVWCMTVVAGMAMLWNYALRPGSEHEPNAGWPGGSRIGRDPNRPTLVLFAHSECPCTRASLGELNGVLARTDGRLAVRVVLSAAEGSENGWRESELASSAAAIPGVTVMRDPGAVEANRFGAATSGETLLYNARGRLIFAGGITAARGHSGSNEGASAIVSLVNHGAAERTRTAVYGCSLRNALSAAE